MEKRVTGLGGIFFKSQDPKGMNEWYKQHLGLPTGEWGTNIQWRHASKPDQLGHTVWAPFAHDTTYYAPSTSEFMVNFRVSDLEGLLAKLKDEGVTVVGEIQSFEYGKFGWILDPEGRKIELWEPNEEEYLKLDPDEKFVLKT